MTLTRMEAPDGDGSAFMFDDDDEYSVDLMSLATLSISSPTQEDFDQQENLNDKIDDDKSDKDFLSLPRALHNHVHDASEKQEYLEALDQAPDLVRTESVWDDFLWAEDYHVARAALRVARYWKSRKFVFGGERWLRPLNQTGTGALSSDDIAKLRSGYYIGRPRHKDGKGVVTFIDYSRLPGPEEDTSIRLSFYYAKLYGKQGRAGNLILHLKSGAPRPNAGVARKGTPIYHVALPVKFSQRQVLVVKSCFDKGREALLDFLTFQTAKYVEQTGATVKCILGDSVHDTLCMLQQATGGVQADCIPQSLGGTYEYEHEVGEWVRECLSEDFWQMSFCTTTSITTACLGRNHSPTNDHPKDIPCAVQVPMSHRIGNDANQRDSLVPKHDDLSQQQSQNTTILLQKLPPTQGVLRLQWVDYREPQTVIAQKREALDQYFRKHTFL